MLPPPLLGRFRPEAVTTAENTEKFYFIPNWYNYLTKDVLDSLLLSNDALGKSGV